MIRKITALTFFILLSIPFTLTAKVIYVNGSYSGTTEDGTSWATPYKTIDTAIAKAAAGDEIWVAKGNYVAPSKASLQGIYIHKDLTIIGGFNGDETSVFLRDFEGNKTILEADNSGENISTRIFSIDPNIILSLDGLSFTNFHSAITEHYDTLTSSVSIQIGDRYNLKINNCKFDNGVNSIQFGYFSNLEISNTEFNNAGRIYIDEYLKPGDIEVSDVLIQNCVIKNYPEKHFLIINKPAQIKVIGSSFLNNNTGSSTFMVFENCDIEFFQCAFENNSGSNQLMVFLTCNVKFSQCTFQNNYELKLFLTTFGSKKLDINDCLFKNNTNQGSGLMTVEDNETEFFIRNSTFESNATRLVYSVTSNIKILNTNFINNTNANLGVTGGHMLILTPNNPNSNIEIEGSKFINNKIEKGFIGLIGGDGLKLKIFESEFKGNEVTEINAAFFFYLGSIQMDNCIFEGNRNPFDNFLKIDAAAGNVTHSYINNTKFLNNTANTSG
ncbi:MAG TPA: right-handed parallel beta-helix repeat-containing protein, partial [Cytophagaceae bacterium]